MVRSLLIGFWIALDVGSGMMAIAPPGYGKGDKEASALLPPTPSAALRFPSNQRQTPTPAVRVAQRIPARDGVWRRAGCGGAGVFITLHFDPVRAGVLYVASDVGGAYRSSARR